MTGADTKFVLLHEGKNDEGIRAFFMEMWELYVKVRGHSWARTRADWLRRWRTRSRRRTRRSGAWCLTAGCGGVRASTCRVAGVRGGIVQRWRCWFDSSLTWLGWQFRPFLSLFLSFINKITFLSFSFTCPCVSLPCVRIRPAVSSVHYFLSTILP
jgi:hypothetical protein